VLSRSKRFVLLDEMKIKKYGIQNTELKTKAVSIGIFVFL